MSGLSAFAVAIAGVGLVGIVASYIWGMAGAKNDR